jgi:two-component system, sensor histidine kinase and response regulator
MKKILVIEDSHFVLKKVITILEKEGFKVLSAENGSDGVKLAKGHLPNLIISDIEMPELDGYQVLTELSEDPLTSTIPFIFMTAAKKKWSEVRFGMGLGADDYLTKPFTEEELLTAVNSRLEKNEIFKKKSEEKLEELRSNIIYALPHEFRTPLSTIMMASSYIMSRYEDIEREDIRKMTEKINRSGQRLQHLIENFLLYVQIETLSYHTDHLKKLRAKTIDNPQEIIKYAVISRADEKNRTEDIDMNLTVASIKITRENLEKIIGELIDNALKFSEKGDKIIIDTEKTDWLYKIKITDYGKGMKQEQITKIGAYMQFERKMYEQQGSGFGLIITKRLLELHGGDLNIISKYGEYTELTANIRLNKVNEKKTNS